MDKNTTILGMELFKEQFQQSFIFHIPHSGINIPEQFKSDYTSIELLNNEISLLTDFATDEIFNIGNFTKLVFPYSRIFCDVERLDDEHEEMFKLGRGFYYTKTDKGKILRIESDNKQIIYTDYYLKHHKSLTNIVSKKLEENKFAYIIDCHSFSDKPFETDLNKDEDRPDFCIGVDEYHTPNWLKEILVLFLTNKNYKVKINSPYVGTIVPLDYYQKNENVHSIMIEVNRKLYMDDNNVNSDKVSELNNLLTEFFINYL